MYSQKMEARYFLMQTAVKICDKLWFGLSNTNKLLNLVFFHLQPCDASWGSWVYKWPEELSDNYTPAVFVYNPVKDIRQ